ncbi:MAG: type II secretion system F family protein [Candidatus Saccharimonadales bacterium]|jgi:type IV pilus assembly protein PilC
MLTYTYTARNTSTGETVKAEIEAADEQSAAKTLIDRGLAPVDIKLKKEQTGFLSDLRNRIKTKQKVIFSRQLATMVNAGLPLAQSLNTVRGQTNSKPLKDVISSVIVDVESGSSFADALSRHPKVFNSVYISLVAAGEASGTLDTSLGRLANQQEKDAEIVSKVRGAMIYPIIVILVLIAVVVFMMTTVLPEVQSLYKGIPGAKLPFVTVILLGVAHFIINFWWLVILILALGGFLLTRWAHTGRGIEVIDGLKLRVWPVGPLFSKLYMARFARTGAILAASGVPMIKMLNTTADAVDNTHVAESIHKATEQVKGGKALSDSLKGDPNFLELVPDMIHIGEQSGALQDMLSKVADYYEKEVDEQIQAVSTIIEPALMIIVGIIALTIVAAVLLPIYSLAGKNLTSGL